MLDKLDRLVEKCFGSHISIGNLTIFGRNAMHFGITFWTKKYGYICFRLPLFCYGRWHPLYLYFSPNATPWASTFMLGRKHDRQDWTLARLRRYRLGHNFDTDICRDELRRINNLL